MHRWHARSPTGNNNNNIILISPPVPAAISPEHHSAPTSVSTRTVPETAGVAARAGRRLSFPLTICYDYPAGITSVLCHSRHVPQRVRFASNTLHAAGCRTAHDVRMAPRRRHFGRVPARRSSGTHCYTAARRSISHRDVHVRVPSAYIRWTRRCCAVPWWGHAHVPRPHPLAGRLHGVQAGTLLPRPGIVVGIEEFEIL